MNPYDFVRIDWQRVPERHKPAWHHRFVDGQGKALYSGHILVDIIAETPLFVADPRLTPKDPKRPTPFIKNAQGEYIIPGNSLKGMLRCLVETLGNACLTLYDGSYESNKVNYWRETPKEFQHCKRTDQLCLACRIFGSMPDRQQPVFLGKVNISDACVYSDKIYTYEPLYTKPLMTPKPHHASFYLDEQRKHIAGRKYYFHHEFDYDNAGTNKGIIMMGGKPANRYIEPLDYGTEFHFRINFTNLEAEEFGALLYAIALEEGIRHKIGYGKPLGFGTIRLEPTEITLVDYIKRYSQASTDRGMTRLSDDQLWSYIYERSDVFVNGQLSELALRDLKRIWCWQPNPDVEYYYPSKRDWFDKPESRGKKIADTRNVPG